MSEPAVHCSAATHPGCVRLGNEDTIAVSGAVDYPLTRWNGVLTARGGWAVVADGMGGHVAGEVASQVVVELLRPILSTLATPRDVQEAINSANHALFDTMARHSAFEGMGTTLAGVVLHEDGVLAFNVGDSRLYIYKDGDLGQISEDDAVSGHMLTQCLGGSGRPTFLDAHVRAIPLSYGAKLLLCTDGLTDMVDDDRIAAVLGLCSDNPAEFLVKEALDAGGVDNVSAIVLQFQA